MRIGIDIDGVLTNVSRFQLDYGSMFFNKRVVNPNAFEIRDIYDVSEEEEKAFWDKYLEVYATTYPARFFASEALKRFHEMGIEIIILTARFKSLEDNETGERMREIVKDWLKRNDLYYDKIIFSKENKDKRVEEFNIDLMIEDKPKNIYDISKKVPVIIVDDRYNANCEIENSVRCYNWYEIYSVVKNSMKKFDK